MTDRPAWITGFEHRIEPHNLSLATCTGPVVHRGQPRRWTSTALDLAELHAPFSHQELLVRATLGLADDVSVNPSGGALAGNPMFTAGLNRIGEAARRIWAGARARPSRTPPRARRSSRTSSASS